MDRVTMRVLRINEAHFAAQPLTKNSHARSPLLRGCVRRRRPHKLTRRKEITPQPEERGFSQMNHEISI
jgi:hypothetical protein